MNSKYFHLFANCFIVKGHNRSLIFDSQRMKTVFVPNDMYDIITKAKSTSIQQIYAEYGIDNKEIINEKSIYIVSHGRSYNFGP